MNKDSNNRQELTAEEQRLEEARQRIIDTAPSRCTIKKTSSIDQNVVGTVVNFDLYRFAIKFR